ncbi:hypothetical protein [Blastococcus saxobsidens]|uniref:hypothetical protein n=1 Tax=Blastococcus saxobsidens TaxID=138336 RepID=UPI00102AABD9|nr:hypothetical protein [Blastococcus saxobsidens]
MATLQRIQPDHGAPAARLVDEVRQMSPAELAARIEEARNSSPAQIVERQKRERRQRAERAAARFAV